MLGHAYPDAFASGVDHGLEVTGGVDPVVDSVLSSICCASKYGEVVTESIGLTGICGGFTLLRSVMPGVALVGAGLCCVHQGLIDRQFQDPIGFTGLVDKPDHFLPDLHVVCQTGTVPAGGCFRRGGGGGADRQRYSSMIPDTVGCDDLRSSL